jgi:probable F420-dependent oxidoreductase
MRFGVVLFTSDRGITPAGAALAAEAAGFDCFYVPEHTHIPVRRDALHPRTGTQDLPDDRYMRTLDPWVSLSMAAAVTSTIRLGTAVALPAEHDPITLAKTIASLDHLSGGRVTLGVGFGWNTDELTDHGVPAGKRRTVLREYLEAMQALWSQEEASYDGQFVSFGRSWAWPKPAQQPRIPIVVGAGGAEKTFAWIARSGDGWLTTPGETDLDAKVAMLHRAWRDAGRDGLPQVHVLAGRPAADLLAHWREVGVTDVAFGMPDRAQDEVVGYLGRLAGKLGLTPAPVP